MNKKYITLFTVVNNLLERKPNKYIYIFLYIRTEKIIKLFDKHLIVYSLKIIRK